MARQLKRTYILRSLISFTISLVSILLSTGVWAQKALKTSDFVRWNSITEWKISNRGTFVAWVEEPGRGDKNLYVRNLQTGDNYKIPRGSSPHFSGDEGIMIAKIQPLFDTLRKLKLKKIKESNLPGDSVLIWNLTENRKIHLAGLKDFKAQEKGSMVTALLKSRQAHDTANQNKLKNLNEKSYELLIYSASWDSVRRYSRVTEIYLPDSLPLVLWVSQNPTGDSSMLMIQEKSKPAPFVAYGLKGKITQPCIDAQGKRIAFLAGRDTTSHARLAALLLDLSNLKITQVADSMLSPETPELRISPYYQPWFSKSGERLFLGYYRTLPEKPRKDTLLAEEKALLDLWSWTDPLLQPQQAKRLEKDKNKAWLMVYSFKTGKLFLAGNDSIERIETYREGNTPVALGYNYKPYQQLQSWDDTYYDVYLIDLLQNKYRLLLRKHNSEAVLSPNGRYFIWFAPEQGQWYSLNLKTKQTHCLTCKLQSTFYKQEHDLPSLPPSYGMAGWTREDARVWIYDERDIWSFDPEGKFPPQNLTLSSSQNKTIRFRYLNEHAEEPYIDTSRPVLLSAFFENNKASGYYRLSFNKDIPSMDSLFAGDFRLSDPLKALWADKYLFRRETFREFPDLFVCGSNFNDIEKLSDANPWQKEYKWGQVQLVRWTSLQGKKLEGLLYTPDDFSPTRKYPMIVYFYERNADELHRYILPRPSRSIINQSYLVSNDYLVFVPDIIYGTGNPGQDAYDCVVSGVSSLIDKGFVDEKHIGIQGQSWGGYQTAYLITRTDMFACAMAGAPVSNMTSAYGGIRWESGMSRMFQYEKAQSRIGGTLWDKTLNYINNSPLFFADHIHTPLLIMSNDQDGAVPWYQGIELFSALRRLGKPCWMLVYNNEEHNLKAGSWGNRMDLSIRMNQFFDHYLKNQPAPRWMKEGIPAHLKGIDLGY
ncbi:MAG: alpha/beta hydrolase family protein [Bacteroidales bacterium]